MRILFFIGILHNDVITYSAIHNAKDTTIISP